MPKPPKPRERESNWLMPSQWMPTNPEVADVAEWGMNPLPVYTDQLGPNEESEAEERIAAAQAKRLEEVDPDVEKRKLQGQEE